MQSHLLSFGFQSRMMDLRTTSVFLIGHSLLQIPKFSTCSVYPGGILPLYVKSMIQVLGNWDKVSKDTDCGWWHFLAWRRGLGGTFLNLLLCVVESIVNPIKVFAFIRVWKSIAPLLHSQFKTLFTDLTCCKFFSFALFIRCLLYSPLKFVEQTKNKKCSGIQIWLGYEESIPYLLLWPPQNSVHYISFSFHLLFFCRYKAMLYSILYLRIF